MEQDHDLPLKHHQTVRMPANIRVHRHRIHEALVVLAVEELEAVHPHLLDVARVHPAVAVGRCEGKEELSVSLPQKNKTQFQKRKEKKKTFLTFLNKHHRRQIVRIPTRGDLAQAGGDPRFERFHPVVRVLGVVDGDPLVAGAQPVALAVVVGEGVVVFEAVLEHELGAFLGGFPPARGGGGGSDDE
jgi:hypothetical protein